MSKVSVTDATKNICIGPCKINEAIVSPDTQVLYTHCCSFSLSDVYKNLKVNVIECSVAHFCFALKVFLFIYVTTEPCLDHKDVLGTVFPIHHILMRSFAIHLKILNKLH